VEPRFRHDGVGDFTSRLVGREYHSRVNPRQRSAIGGIAAVALRFRGERSFDFMCKTAVSLAADPGDKAGDESARRRSEWIACKPMS
jgi:hypothetical protein